MHRIRSSNTYNGKPGWLHTDIFIWLYSSVWQVDNYFVPPLNFLAEMLKLSPSIAGITLLALGNGNCCSHHQDSHTRSWWYHRHSM